MSDPLGQGPPDDIVRKPRWPTAAVIAAYRYVLEGVRILGEAHSTYDGRGPQQMAARCSAAYLWIAKRP